MKYAPIISKASSSDFEIAPAGAHTARCVDVIARPPQTDKFGKTRDKVELVWVINEPMQDGRNFIVWQKYTNSIAEVAILGQHLASWRGKPFTEAEMAGFQIENVIGVPCMLNIVHNPVGGKTYANVKTIMPLPKGATAPDAPSDYIRQIERNPSRDVRSNYYSEHGNPVAESKPTNEPALADAFGADDDLPF